jgi:hypothetical protein
MPLNITINGQADLGVTTGIPATITVQMGVPGAAATVAVGTTTTGNAGTDAEVVNVGTLSNAILDFTIPRGDTGAGVAVGGSAGQVLAKIDGTNYNTEWVDAGSDFTGYQYEIHISQIDGSDTTGDGSLLNPYASITKGLTAVTSQRKTLIIHPGTYTESPSITVQYTVLTTFGLVGGNTVISGTVSTNKGCTISGLKMTNLTITAPTGTGNVNILNCDISGGTLTKSGTSDYTLIRFCDIGTTSITGSAGLVAIFGGNPNFITINNAGARVIVKNAVTVAPVLLAGNANFVDSILIATGATSNALTTSAGTIVTLANSQVIVPSFNNVARVSLSGFYSIFNTVFDKPNSTLVATSATGGSTNSIDYFQQINADGITLSGTLFLPGLRNLLNTDLTVTAYNDTGAGTNFVHTFDAFDGTFALATNGGGLKFPDETVQVTAGLPLTGGTLTGSLALSDDVFASNVSKTISANAIDGDSHSGFTLANGGSPYGASLTINFGNDGEEYENQAILAQSSLTFKEAISGDVFASYGQGGITFSDATIQATAALPLTGGTMTGAVTFDGANGAGISVTNYADVTTSIGDGIELSLTNLTAPEVESIILYPSYLQIYDVDSSEDTQTFTVNLSGIEKTGAAAFSLLADSGLTMDNGISFTPTTGLTLKADSGSKITFPDLTEQTTAFPPTGGTATQYIDGIGGLVEFPEVGDRYLTSSNNPLTIDNGNGKTLTVGTGLAYSAQQNITVYHNAGNFMSGTVVSYNSATGDLVFDSDHHTGTGTFSSWTVNVGGAGGVLTFATTAQAQAGTSTTTVISPATLLDAKYFQGGVTMNTILWSTATSGAGAGANQQNGNGRLNTAPTTAIGYAVASAPVVNTSRGLGYASAYDFSKRVVFGSRIARNVVSPDANSVWRLSIGKFVATATIGDLAGRGLMIKVAGSGALQLLVHNGTALTTTTSSFTPSNASTYDVIVVSDGAGNATLYVNGSSVATSSGAPITAGSVSNNGLHFETENTSVITGSPQSICISNTFVQVNV